jgi:competence protein ComEA
MAGEFATTICRSAAAADEPVAAAAACSTRLAQARSAEQRRLWRALGRLRQCVWAPVALRAATIVALMLALAGIGASSILSDAEGVVLARSAAGAANTWLAGARTDDSGVHAARFGAATRAGSGAHPPGAPVASASSGTAKAAADPPSGITRDGKVILNAATAEQLTRLPGVGVKRAAAIVKLRDRLKRFRRVTDLLRVRGIGVKTLKRMLPHLVLNPPPPGDQHQQGDQ